MRALSVVGLGAIVATAGACVALSGIGDYLACTDSCDDGAPTPHDASVPDVRLPPGDSRPTPDVTVPVDMGTTPVPEASPDDAGLDDVTVPPMDAGDARPPDSGTDADAAKEAGPVLGTTCGPKGTATRCMGTQVCCATFATQSNACAASCDAGATLGCSVPSDCPASAPFCCAHMTLGGLFPACTVSQFNSVCAATCSDAPPNNLCVYNNGIIRLCAHDHECTADTANPLCYNFNNAPESWCTTSAIGAAAGAVEQTN